jgi:hypothetical protein
MRMRDDALSRFVEREHALILVDPLRGPVVAAAARRFGFVELVRTPARVILAPR